MLRGETSTQVPKINDCSSLVGEDVQNNEYRTLPGCASGCSRSTFKLDGVGVDLSNAFFILVRVRLKLLCLLYYCASTLN